MSRIKLLAILLVLGVTVAMSGCIFPTPKPAAPGVGSLRVTVVDALSNSTVAGVLATIDGNLNPTDASGVVEFSELPEGSVTLQLSKSGYKARELSVTVLRDQLSVVQVAIVPEEFESMTFAAHWDSGYAAEFHGANTEQPLVVGGTLGETAGYGTLTLLGDPITYSNSENEIVNPNSGTIVLWMIPQTPMSGPPSDVYTLIDILTTTPEGRTDSGFHVWWGWGGFQFKAHDQQQEVASVWYASLWQTGEHHALAVSWDKSQDAVVIYADGEKIRSASFPGVSAVAEKISFGARHAGTQPFNNLVLDKVMIFDRSLDQDELEALLSY